MTKKDYIIVAKCLNEVYRPIADKFNPESFDKANDEYAYKIYVIQQILGKMFTAFELDNPKFDWAKFKKEVYK